VNWLNYLRNTHLNGLIADDMGLGKTIQVITVLAYAYETLSKQYSDESQYIKPSLVICPKSVVVVWKEQLSRFYPTIRTGVVMGKNNIDDYLKSATATNKIILITTYETVTYRKESFLNYDYLYIILDEAQKIKNHQTQMSRTIKMINATHKLAMTGTPIENHLTELWSIFDFIMSGYLGTIDKFKTRYQKPISEGNGTISRILKKKIDPFKIRRTKKQRDISTGEQIIKLPELIIDNIKVTLNPHQSKLYRKILNSKETKALKQRLKEGEKITSLSLNIFAILTRLKQICNHPLLLPQELLTDFEVSSKIKSEKFESLKEKIEEIVESEQKAVIFSQYKKMLNIIEDYLNQNDIGYSKLVGGMSQKNREDHISRFQNDEKNQYPVFLASLKAGGVGISLTSASNVIHYDRWWNPAVENQATDRVYRSGNTSLIVNVYKFISISTIEEKIDRIMSRKQALLDNIIQENKAGGLDNSFTRNELLDLLSDID
jgi:SNF2 family DNA or RNA helicase